MKYLIYFISLFLSVSSYAQERLRVACQDKTKEDIHKTITQYKEYLLRHPDSIRMVYELGMSYYKLQKMDTAMNYFDQVIALNPHYGGVFLNRGICRLFLKDDAGACNDFKKSIEMDKDYENEFGDQSVSTYIKTHCN